VQDAATERPEVLQSAVWVGALNPGNTPAVVAAAQKALHCLGDPLQPELSESLGELSLITGDELGEVGAEQPLQRADSPLAVGAGGGRNQGQGQLVGHRKEDGPKKRDAFPTRLSVSPTAVRETCGLGAIPAAPRGTQPLAFFTISMAALQLSLI
jgi:hypothetical protein